MNKTDIILLVTYSCVASILIFVALSAIPVDPVVRVIDKNRRRGRETHDDLGRWTVSRGKLRDFLLDFLRLPDGAARLAEAEKIISHLPCRHSRQILQ
ncbi:hypothetical protein [Geobacter pickeringii]|uniref:Uncharacterized protein n=1 Tax=Geobacter pickeringii TaxID=345632 RepID=A0A0B5BEK7_9BACT|nr:hypothetical protein [Geobacter pickeringii]AJE03594.1 hypothetical protein GPICK_09735 [Geobacter pickeringii]